MNGLKKNVWRCELGKVVSISDHKKPIEALLVKVVCPECFNDKLIVYTTQLECGECGMICDVDVGFSDKVEPEFRDDM